MPILIIYNYNIVWPIYLPTLFYYYYCLFIYLFFTLWFSEYLTERIPDQCRTRIAVTLFLLIPHKPVWLNLEVCVYLVFFCTVFVPTYPPNNVGYLIKRLPEFRSKYERNAWWMQRMLRWYRMDWKPLGVLWWA